MGGFMSVPRAHHLLILLGAAAVLITMLIGWTPLPVPPAAAQGGSVCPPIVGRALESVGTACAGLGRNSACYGYRSVSATFSSPQPVGFFSRVGDTADLFTLETVRTSPLDLARNQWGVALLNLQASLPNTLPGQNLTFLLLGDAQIENAVAPEAAFRGGIPVNVRTILSANLYQSPSVDSAILGTLEAGSALPADARSEDDAWFRVTYNGQYGWAARTVLDVPAPAARLPVYSPQTYPAPMQTFFLRTGAGSPICDEAPDALIVQGPRGMTVDFTVNGANLRIGSTVVLRTLPLNSPPGDGLPPDPPDDISGFLQISVLDGEVIIEPESDDPIVIEENETTLTCLDRPQNLGIDGQPNDQLVTDRCGGWDDPAPLPDALRQSLRLLDDYPLDYPIPVFDDPTPTPEPPTATSVPPTATSVPPTATPEPPTATPVPPTVTSVPPTATPVTPVNTPTPTATTTASLTAQDLGVAVTAPASVAGTNVTYTVTASNLDSDPVDDIIVTLTPPAGLTFVSSSSPLIGNLWHVGSLPGGGSQTLTVTYFIPLAEVGIPQTLSAAISSISNIDSNPANDSDSATTTPATGVDIGLAVDDFSEPPFRELDSYWIRYEVVNASATDDALNVVITDLLPTNTTFSAYTGPGVYSPATDTLTLGSVAPGSALLLRFDFTFDGAIAGTTQSSSATLTADNDITPGNNEAPASFIINTQADLSVTIAPSTLSPVVGVPFTVQIDVTNNDAAHTVNDIEVPCTVPPGLTINSGGCPWTIPSLGPGGTATFTLDLTANPPTTGIPQTISAGPLYAFTNDDSISGNDTASTSVTPLPALVDVGFSGLNVVNAPYEEGETIFITYTIDNTDPVTPAFNIVIADLLPAGVTFSGYSGPGTYNPLTDTLTIASLAPVASVNLNFEVIVDSGTGGSLLSNTAALTADNDSTPGDNVTPVGIFISTSADLEVVTSASTLTPLTDTPFTVTMTVTNHSLTQTVSGIELSYSTDALTVISITPGSGTAGAGTWSIPSLGPGSSTTLTFDLTAPAALDDVPQTVGGFGLTSPTNIDPNSANDSSFITIVPSII